MWNNRCFGVNDTADCEICKQINDVEVAWLGDPGILISRTYFNMHCIDFPFK